MRERNSYFACKPSDRVLAPAARLAGHRAILSAILAAGALSLLYDSNDVPEAREVGGRAQGTASQRADARGDELSRVQSALSEIHSSDRHALANALGIDPALKKDDSSASPTDSLDELGDLDGDGIPEMALKKWSRPVELSTASKAHDEAVPGWSLFLLSWEGTRWRASQLMAGFEPVQLRVLPSPRSGNPEIVVVVFAGHNAVPYPAAFRFQDHAASLVWDGRSEDTAYQGYNHGEVEFLKADGIPEMIVTGRADPGLLVFSPDARRGFEVRAVYAWNGKAFVPTKTEYSANEDFRLYQLISALHLRDFRSAYAVIDPAVFLGTDMPSLEIFRKRIEEAWPEFLDDKIFKASEPDPASRDDHAFELALNGKRYVYQPKFSADAKHLLTGLERREENEK